MNAISLNNLWRYLQGLPLSASNQRWLGERLIEASVSRTEQTEETEKLEKMKAMFGIWSDAEGEEIEQAVRDARQVDYNREIASLDK